MKKSNTVAAVLAAIATAVTIAFVANAGDRDLTFRGIKSLLALGAAPASGDLIPVFDVSSGLMKKLDAVYLQVTDGTGPSAAELDYLTGVTAGTSAASKAVVLDSNSKISALDITALTLNGVAANEAALTNTARFSFRICGDATTVNNNTVYYGSGTTLTANTHDGLDCDINAAGNVTEATADEPVLDVAFQVLGMVCRNEGDANADISFTLRTAAGATSPSVTCTIADGGRYCAADVQTSTNVGAGATVAIAAASAGDIGDGNGFVCLVQAAY